MPWPAAEAFLEYLNTLMSPSVLFKKANQGVYCMDVRTVQVA
jgi:hypothetical protein